MVTKLFFLIQSVSSTASYRTVPYHTASASAATLSLINDCGIPFTLWSTLIVDNSSLSSLARRTVEAESSAPPRACLVVYTRKTTLCMYVIEPAKRVQMTPSRFVEALSLPLGLACRAWSRLAQQDDACLGKRQEASEYSTHHGGDESMRWLN